MKVKWTITLITNEPDMTMADQISEIRGKLWWGRPKANVIQEKGEIIKEEDEWEEMLMNYLQQVREGEERLREKWNQSHPTGTDC